MLNFQSNLSQSPYTLSLDEEIQNFTIEIQQKIDELPEFFTNEKRKIIRKAMSTSFGTGIRAQGH